MGTTNLVDGTANPFDIVLYVDKACTIKVETSLNYAVDVTTLAVGGTITIASGPGSFSPGTVNGYSGSSLGNISGNLTSGNNTPLTLRNVFSRLEARAQQSSHVTAAINQAQVLRLMDKGRFQPSN